MSHKTISVALAFTVLISTLSFTVESHYCGDFLVDTAVFSKAKSCGGEMASDSQKQKSCCKDEVEIIKGQDTLHMVTFDDLEINTQWLLISYVSSYTALFESLPKPIIPHKNYIPPNLVVDIQLLDDVFLI